MKYSLPDTLYLECCERCQARQMTAPICCDICVPMAFSSLRNSGQKCTSCKWHQMKTVDLLTTPSEKKLEGELCRWCLEVFKTHWTVPVSHWGPEIIISGELIAWIVRLATKKKLMNIGELELQTNWAYSHKYGADLLNVLERIFPQRDPKRQLKKRGPQKCSNCRRTGHNSESLVYLQ